MNEQLKAFCLNGSHQVASAETGPLPVVCIMQMPGGIVVSGIGAVRELRDACNFALSYHEDQQKGVKSC